MNIIRIPGLADYQKTLRMQEELVRAHQDDPEREDELLLLEHASVYTIGRTRDHASLHPGTVLPFPIHEIRRSIDFSIERFHLRSFAYRKPRSVG